jgi:hypothetical protein
VAKRALAAKVVRRLVIQVAIGAIRRSNRGVIECSISPINSAVTQRTLARVVILRLVFFVARKAIIGTSQRMVEMDVAP